MTRRLAAVLLLTLLPAASFAQRGGPPPDGRAGGPGGPPPTPRAGAPIDLTGYWVSVVTEDWRYRMVTPTRGDFQGVPMTPEAMKLADAWDPAADTAAGTQCKSYGAAAIMRVPGRLHVAWDDDSTLRVDTDAGTQTRLFRFAQPAAAPRPKGEPSWQGESVATWELPGRGRGRGTQPPPPPAFAPGATAGGPASARGAAGPPPRPQFGALKVVTTNLRAGYLRKNGVPYSENATVTEYFDVAKLRGGQDLMVVTTIVEDPRYLAQPFIISTQFKKQRDAAGWEPTPCSATW